MSLSAGLTRITVNQPAPTTKLPSTTGIPLYTGGETDRRNRYRLQQELRLLEERLPIMAMDELQLTVMSSEEIKQMATVKIESPEITGVESVNSSAMGVTDDILVCSTCGNDNYNCPGHLGYIELNIPIYNPLFLRELILVLNSVCNTCGGMLLNKVYLKSKGIDRYSGLHRLELIEKESIGQCCSREHGEDVAPCLKNPIYLQKPSKESHSIIFILSEKDKSQHTKSLEDVEKILQSISREDAELLGFSNGSHPANLIMRNFPVIPPIARPPTIVGGVIRQDPFTEMYREIVRYNNLLKQPLSEPDRAKAIDNLKTVIESLFDNRERKRKIGKQIVPGFYQFITGKEALIRSLLMGKRVNYSGRTVIAPDPSLRFGEVRIPEKMAPFLTVPDKITSFNRNRYNQLLKENKITYIVRGSGKFRGERHAITEETRRELLESGGFQLGDKVERWLENGDYVMFNRQPSIHKQTMMGYKVVLGPQLTIGVHLSATTPHGADFDGDEANLHAPQLIQASVEIAEIVNIKSCIMNAQNNRPMVGAVLDTVTGAYLLTSDKEQEMERVIVEQTLSPEGVVISEQEFPYSDELYYEVLPPHRQRFLRDKPVYTSEMKPKMKELEIDRALFYDLLSALVSKSQLPTLRERLEKHGVPPFSGRALFSAFLPEDFYYYKSGELGPQKNHVLIIDGVLVKGIITKEHIGSANNSIIQTMWKNYGAERTSEFLTDISLIIPRWLTERGFSIGIDDCIPENPAYKYEIEKIINEAELKIQALGGKKEDPVEEKRRQNAIDNILNNINNIGKIISLKGLSIDNAFNVMALSGAKGTPFNIAQIIGMLGQMYSHDTRPKPQGARISAYTEEGDESLQAGGFIPNSYFTGLTPLEVIFQQLGARENIASTALATPTTGYLSRKLMESLRDIQTDEKRAVRNMKGVIIQFLYGDDAFDAQHLVNVKGKTEKFPFFIDITETIEKINAKYGYYPSVYHSS